MAKKRFFIVPNDRQLREEFNQALVVICTVRCTDGKEYDVIDYSYVSSRPDIKELLKHCEEAELDVIERGEL